MGDKPTQLPIAIRVGNRITKEAIICRFNKNGHRLAPRPELTLQPETLEAKTQLNRAHLITHQHLFPQISSS